MAGPTVQGRASRGVPEKWRFSPQRLRGHRERLGLSRAALAAAIGRKADTIKFYEYGTITPSLEIFLSLCDSLGISPGDLCRTSSDDGIERMEGRLWPMPPTTARSL